MAVKSEFRIESESVIIIINVTERERQKLFINSFSIHLRF